MRTVAKVVGVGQRMKGTSKKTGKGYDFQTLCINYCDGRIAGEAAASPLINGPDLDAVGGVNVGDQLDIFCHEFGGKLVIDGIICKL